jgi:hypothetical protein
MGQKPKVIQVPYAVVVHDTVKIDCPDAKKVRRHVPRPKAIVAHAVPCTTIVRVECTGNPQLSYPVTLPKDKKDGVSHSNPDVRPSLEFLIGTGSLHNRGDITIIEPPKKCKDKPEAHDPPYERNGDVWKVHALVTVPVSANLSLLGGVDHWSLDYGTSPFPTIVPDRERTRFTSFSVGGKWWFGK